MKALFNPPGKNKRVLTYIPFIIIIAASFMLHFSHFSQEIIGIHSWRQTQTQQNIVNFYRRDFNIFNPRVFNYDGAGNNILRYEFPIMQWFIALLIKIFGHPVLVTRLTVFIIGLCSTLGMYKILRLLTNNGFGSWMGAWLFACSPVFFFYTINPLPDNLALSGAIWFLYCFLKYTRTLSINWIYWSAFFLLLATLSKLPYIILSAAVGFYLLRKWKEKRSYQIFLIYALAILPALAWYVWVIPGWEGNGVLYGVFRAGGGDNSYASVLDYHKTFMFPKRLLNDASLFVFFIGVLFMLLYKKYQRIEFGMLLTSTIAVVGYWLLELNMINTSHDYYMMPFLPFLYIVAGYGIICLWRSNLPLKMVAIFFVVETAAVTSYETRNDWSKEMAYSNPSIWDFEEDLRNAVPSDAKVVVTKDGSPYVYLYMFDKMGYVVSENFYPPEQLQDLIKNKGVRYLYSDDRRTDSAEVYQPFFKRQIMQRGNIKVFELQPEPGL